MKNLLLPGLGTGAGFYRTFLGLLPEITLVENPRFTYQEAAGHLAAQTAKGEKVNLCGWSLGSLFALRWALENPQRVNALFLSGATACFCERSGYRNGIGQKTLLSMIKLIQRNPRRIMENFFLSALEGVPDKQVYTAALLQDPPAAADFINGLKELQQTDLVDELAGLRCPVWIFHGTHDPITPLSGARIIRDKLPDCRLIEQQGGHCLLLEETQLFSGLFREFITKVSL